MASTVDLEIFNHKVEVTNSNACTVMPKPLSKSLWHKLAPLTPEERGATCVSILKEMLADWEQSHPNWQLLVLYWLQERALHSLRKYLESETETEISWESPYVELRYPMNVTWQNEGTENSTFSITTGTLEFETLIDSESATKAFSSLMMDHLHIVALQDYTNGTSYEIKGSTMVPRMEPSDLAAIEKLYPQELEQEKQIKRLFWPKSFGAGSIDFDTLEDGAPISEEAGEQLAQILPPLLVLPIAGLPYRVISILEIHPLMVDPAAREAYFPITVGLAIQADGETFPDTSEVPEVPTFDRWSTDEKSLLWDAIETLLKATYDELTPKLLPEFEEALIEVSSHIKVLVPRGDRQAMTKVKEQIMSSLNSAGELLHFEMKSGHGLSSNETSALPLMLEQVHSANTPYEKGHSLEQLLTALFESIPGFRVEERVRTETEEIDLWVTNERNDVPWRNEGDIVIVECKNWSTKCGKDEFNLLERKMTNRGKRCSIAILVSWNGFAKTIKAESLRGSREPGLVIPLDGQEITTAVRSGDFLSILKSARIRALRA